MRHCHIFDEKSLISWPGSLVGRVQVIRRLSSCRDLGQGGNLGFRWVHYGSYPFHIKKSKYHDWKLWLTMMKPLKVGQNMEHNGKHHPTNAFNNELFIGFKGLNNLYETSMKPMRAWMAARKWKKHWNNCKFLMGFLNLFHLMVRSWWTFRHGDLDTAEAQIEVPIWRIPG